MKVYQLYCFDLDDTLVATFDHVRNNLYVRLAAQLRLPAPSDAAIQENWGRPLNDSLRSLFGEQADLNEVVSSLRKLHLRHPAPPQPAAERILSVLRRHGRSVAVFSRGDPEIVTSTLRLSLNLDPSDLGALYFMANAGSRTDDMIHEMRLEASRRAAREIPADRVLVVSDTPEDRRFAVLNGADFRGLAMGRYTQNDHLAQGTPAGDVFPSLASALAAPANHGVVAIIQDGKGQFLLLREGRRENPFFGAWSGPHGRCVPEDVLEEETVVRETREECGLEVKPLTRMYERAADTKVKTVAFWAAEMRDHHQKAMLVCPSEVSDIAWLSLDEVTAPGFPLYPGTREFFTKFEGLRDHNTEARGM